MDYLVIHQLMQIPGSEDYEDLLIWNGLITAGSFMLDEDGEILSYQDTLQIENLDLNELEASISAIDTALAEWGDTLNQYYHLES